jgi:hypothetical protein
MGETALDEDIFDEYLMEMKNHYTAEKVWSHWTTNGKHESQRSL